MHFKVILNKTTSTIQSFQQRITIHIKAAGTLNCVNYLMLNPKHSAKYVCRTGTSASSTARAVTSYEMIRQRTRSTSSQFLTSFDSPLQHQEGRPHGHRYGKKEREHEYFIANQLTKKCKKREFLSIHDRFIRDARFRKTMIEMGRTEEVIREMDKWQTRITHTTLLKKKICVS